MRRNLFGDAYCHTAEELLTILNENDLSVDTVYGVKHPEDDSGALPDIEVLTNVEGDTVCYVEADTIEECIAIVAKTGIENIQ